MTKTLTLRSLDIPSIHKFGIGFDNMFDELMRMNAQQGHSNYPPYNVVKLTEDTFNIEVACAGFAEGEIEINLDNRVLTIAGSKTLADSAMEYLHKGISDRSFVREFTIAEHVEVVGAIMKDGILTINLERTVPEEKKPKSIAITYTK
jgi:molecular chaperone IbpA